MKKNIFLLIPVLIYFTSCTDVKKTEEYRLVQTQNDSLKTILHQQNEEINLFVSDFNDIQSNLSQIRQKEHWITINAKEGKKVKDKIQDDIQLIYSLLKENISKVNHLNKKLSASSSKNKALKRLITSLQNQIKEQGAEIITLNQKLKSLNIEIMNLDGELDEAYYLLSEKEDLIQQQTEEINTAYYVVGTSKELKKNKIITKKGGFIGIGRQSKIDNDFNKEYFTKINISDFEQVPIFAKKLKLISTHPEKSYELTKGKSNIDYLVILDKKAFWSVSKYLVIEVKK